MKKLISTLLVLCLLPILLLGGCSNVVGFTKTETTYSSSPDFFSANYKSITDFKTLIKEYNVTNTAEGISTNYEALWNNIARANKEVLFALTAYDMSGKTDERSCPYNLSALSAETADGLGSFLLNRVSADKKEYYYNLNNNEISGFLPKLEYEKPSNIQYIDIADEYIKTWGRAIKFTVSTSDNQIYTIIDVAPTYVFPLEKDVPNQTEPNGNILKIERNAPYLKIVYGVDGNTYTKSVSFINGVKTVYKYDGDITGEGTVTQTNKTYTYSSNEDSYVYQEDFPNLFGKYEIIFDATKSFIYCKHLNNITELYRLKDDIIMARYNFAISSFRSITELLINEDKISGNIVNKKITTVNSGEELRNKELNSSYASYNLNDEQKSNVYYAYSIFNQKINVKTK